jgi:hypothetical protein
MVGLEYRRRMGNSKTGVIAQANDTSAASVVSPK